jgi:hypothetical protein
VNPKSLSVLFDHNLSQISEADSTKCRADRRADARMKLDDDRDVLPAAPLKQKMAAKMMDQLSGTRSLPLTML